MGETNLYHRTHIPKGGMCSVCVHTDRKCDHLPFHEMQPIKKIGWNVIVKCSEFERERNSKASK